MVDSFFRSVFFTALSVLFLSTAVMNSDAYGRSKRQYASTTKPYQDVGKLDKDLSRACQRGEFRQRRTLRKTIGYLGEVGRGITGIATDRWNLIDRKGLRKLNNTYHFYHQGYSDCRVYVAPTPVRN